MLIICYICTLVRAVARLKHICAMSSTWDGHLHSVWDMEAGICVLSKGVIRQVTALSNNESTGPYKTGTRNTRLPKQTKNQEHY